jgi:transcriptional regulator with XRE-family HTH domain
MAKINRLKVVLVEKEKSGKWLADQLGKSTCTVSKWCSNTTQPDLQTLTRIAQLLNVDTRDLLTPSNIQD